MGSTPEVNTCGLLGGRYCKRNMKCLERPRQRDEKHRPLEFEISLKEPNSKDTLSCHEIPAIYAFVTAAGAPNGSSRGISVWKPKIARDFRI